MQFRAIIPAMAALIVTCGVSNASVVIYNSQASFEAAASQIVGFEPFNSGGLQSTTSATTTGASAIGSPRAALNFLSPSPDSVWNGQDGIQADTFSYLGSETIFGGGAWFDTSPGGEGSGLYVVVNLVGGGTDVIGNIGAIDSGFWGFIESQPITGFTVSNDAGVGSGRENYDADNLEFAAAPEPSTVAFTLTGLAALALKLRKRR